MGKTQEILDLLSQGFVPYPHTVPSGFYEKRRCRSRDRATWFMRPRPKEGGTVRAICLGCKKRCSAVNPRIWPVLLEADAPSRNGVMLYTRLERVSVDDLLRMKRVLRVEEAAWALNVSRQKVRHWLEEGVLEKVPGSPVRITVMSIERILRPE